MPATRATRAIVISDLHLGGDRPYLMSRPDRLAAFLTRWPMARSTAKRKISSS